MKSAAENIDCMIRLREMPDKAFDLAIVDPPYGIERTRMNIGGKDEIATYGGSHFDDVRPTDEYFCELRRVSIHQIVWGGNYFTPMLSASSGWIVWQKHVNANATAFSAAELAWTSFDQKILMFCRSIGMDVTEFVNGDFSARRIHPTQKPVALYKWLLTNYARSGDTILDTHLGSGSSRIAAYDLGFDFTGYELDKDYFDAQEQRFANHIAQPKLFEPQAVEQQTMFAAA